MTVYDAAEIGTRYHDDDRSISEKYGRQIAPYFQVDISDKDDTLIMSSGTVAKTGGYDLNGLIINDVQMEEDIEGADAINITINNPRVDLQNSPLFEIGNNIDLYMGYDGRSPFYMMRGIIVEVQPEFPADTIPTIKIKAYDKSYFMMEEGKAEIVPEGSSWWERRTQASVAPTPLNPTISYNNAHGNTAPSENDLAHIDRVNTLAEEQGEPVRMRTVGALTALDSDQDLTRIVVEGGQVRTPAGVEDDPNVNFDAAQQALGRTQQAQTQQGWQRQQFGRRSRQAGKVWRGKTDSEIVAAIFQSYDIVPYVEATSEHRRVYTGRNRPVDPNSGSSSDRTGRPSRGSPESIDDISEAELQRIEDAAGPDESLENARERLASESAAGDPTLPAPPGGDYASNRTAELGDADRAESATPYVNMLNVRPVDFTGEANQLIDDSSSITRGRNAGAGFTDYQWTDDYRYRNVLAERWAEQTPPQTTRETRQREVTQRAGTTDWDFIMKLAKQHGFIVFVFFHIESHEWIGYWGPEDNVPQFRKYTFRYNAGDETTLGTVRPNLSAKNQSTEIDLIYVDPVNGRENRLRVALDNLNENMEELSVPGEMTERRDPIGNGPEVILRIHGERVRVNADRRFTSADDARVWLMSFWLEHARDFYFIEGDTIVGIPEMRAREYHVLEGFGRYSGEFFITQSRHGMSPGQGYRTSFVGRAKSPFREGDEQGDDMLVTDQTVLGESQPTPESETVNV